MTALPPSLQTIRIGTRGSKLALAQAEETRARLIAQYPELAEEGRITFQVMQTSGDKFLEGPLAEIGGKGLFTKEIEEALLCGEIDLAVHSMKDMPTRLPKGLVIGCLFPREDVRDVLITPQGHTLDTLPRGSRLGTSSLRRTTQIMRIRPDVEIVPLRGNVNSRIAKLEAGVVDALMLAYAGMSRLDLLDTRMVPLPTSLILPAVAQGAIGVECRENDSAMLKALLPLHHLPTAICLEAERAMLERLDGSCRTPIAAHAVLDEARGMIRLNGMLATPDASTCIYHSQMGLIANARELGIKTAEALEKGVR